MKIIINENQENILIKENIKVHKGERGKKKSSNGKWADTIKCPHCQNSAFFSMSISDGNKGRGRIKVTDENGKEVDTKVNSIALYYCPSCSRFIAHNNHSNLNENVETEYLDSFYGVPLKKYLQMTDDEKFENRLNYDSSYVMEYIEGKGLDEDLTDGELAELQEYCDNNDAYSIINFLDTHFDRKTINDMNASHEYDFSRFRNSLTHDVMDYDGDIKNEWLIHFSNNASLIADEGFQYATSDMDDLGYSGCGSRIGKDNEGWNFAFRLDDAPNGCGYGTDVVLFRASGVLGYHFGDNERQVMFYNKDAKDLILIERDENSGNWYINSRLTGKVLYEAEELFDVACWAIQNLPQYHKHLISRNESKVRADSFKNSSYQRFLNRQKG